MNPAITNKFVARCGISKGKLDPYIIDGSMDDLNEDGTKELIFGITTGFSLYPRQIYAFDLANDSIWTSPYNGYFLSDILQTDITGDGKPEIIPYGYAASNVHDTTVKYHDHSSWLMVLDRKLQFLFEPVELEGGFSNVMPFFFRRNGKTVFMAAVCPPMHKGDSAYLITFTKEGQISDKTILKYRFNPVVLKDVKNRDDRILFSLHDTLELYDAYFKLKKKVLMENIFKTFTMDIDDDGNDEIIVSQINSSKLTVFRNDLTHPVEFRAEGTGEDLLIYSVNRQKGQPAQFVYQCGQNLYIHRYSLNPRYNLRFVMYASVYLAILLFTLLVRKIQRYQIQKKLDVEKKITDLQLQIVRNQLDPHFSMNAINSIISGIDNENREESREHLMYYAQMHRSLVLSSDQIVRSLQDELDFTADYLALEKYRFKDRFNFEISVKPDLNREILIPKMLLQIHVENAVKHGLTAKKSGGLVTVRCVQENSNLLIEVEDNRVGRQFAKANSEQSTGKGQKVMDEYIMLYNKYNKEKITCEIMDLFDTENNPAGTLVKIQITNVEE